MNKSTQFNKNHPYKEKILVVKPVSEHAPKAKKATDEDFCFFLAGLIDASGTYEPCLTSKENVMKSIKLVLRLHPRDISLAQHIHELIGYGKVRKVPCNRRGVVKSVTYECSKSTGLNLIDAITRDKRVRMNICHAAYAQGRNPGTQIHSGAKGVDQEKAKLVASVELSKVCLTNHWLAGFTQGCGQFNIYLGPTLRQTKLCLQYLNHEHIGDPRSLGVSVSQVQQFIVNNLPLHHVPTMIDYFDKHQLMAGNLTSYWIWRKAYLRLQNPTKKSFVELRGFRQRLKRLNQM